MILFIFLGKTFEQKADVLEGRPFSVKTLQRSVYLLKYPTNNRLDTPRLQIVLHQQEFKTCFRGLSQWKIWLKRIERLRLSSDSYCTITVSNKLNNFFINTWKRCRVGKPCLAQNITSLVENCQYVAIGWSKYSLKVPSYSIYW